ncbi:MAG TPA: glycosyltransferase family 9 protein, partial [Rhodocyclaceae bacterium]|nr:glycosyltransferase family 9 protein [Rhodocyclaceae bacterium]
WVELAKWLDSQGLDIVFSGSGDKDELAYVNAIAQQLPTHCLNLAGQLSLAESADLLKRAVLYVGPDTVMTHMAAATGVPTIALFGPSNPVKWGPWPAQWPLGDAPSLWNRVGSARHGNVFLIQGVGDCVPCMLEGCDRHTDSASACLETLPVARVIAAAETFLKERSAGA